MATISKFPVPAGTVVSLSCNVGYELTGDSEVTCIQDTQFQSTTTLPTCTGNFYLYSAFSQSRRDYQPVRKKIQI